LCWVDKDELSAPFFLPLDPFTAHRFHAAFVIHRFFLLLLFFIKGFSFPATCVRAALHFIRGN